MDNLSADMIEDAPRMIHPVSVENGYPDKFGNKSLNESASKPTVHTTGLERVMIKLTYKGLVHRCSEKITMKRYQVYLLRL